MVKLTGQQRQRVDAERRAELILAEPQQLLQASRAGALTDVAFRVDRLIVASQPTLPVGAPAASSVSIVTETNDAQL